MARFVRSRRHRPVPRGAGSLLHRTAAAVRRYVLGQIATSARLRPGSRCRAASRRSSVRRPTTAAPSGLHQRAVRPCGRAGCPHPPAEGRVLPGVLAAGSRNGRSPPRVQSVITRPPTRPTPTQSRPPKLPDQPSRCRPTSAQAAHQISPFITGVQWPMIMVGTTCGPARAPRRHTSMRVCVSRGSLGRRSWVVDKTEMSHSGVRAGAYSVTPCR